MSEVTEQVAVASPAAEKNVKKTAAPKKSKTKATHPPTAEMVDASITALKQRGGSSVLAIKKYIAATYKVDVEKLAPFIKKYIKGAVVKGHLLQTKGKGASGSFKLSAAAKPKAAKKPAAAGAEKNKKPTTTPAKKTEAKKVAKKAAAKVKVPAAKKSSTVKPAAVKPKKKEEPKKAATPKPVVKKPVTKKVSTKK